MEFAELRRLLTNARSELDDLFARGLNRGHHQNTALREVSADFARAGLLSGADAFARLADSLVLARVDAEWTAAEPAMCFARCREYTRICLERLEDMEAAARLK
ncbi:MAG: hypothetical protein LBQ16_03765 [Gracilibacteraceae bacterium]|nr:hypothetical protein [Gracilibacteraceae bacterium]